MGETVHVILVGAKDSGKFGVINNFFANRNEGMEDAILDKGRDLPTCVPVHKDVEGEKFCFVMTPDITSQSDEISLKSWQDLIIAQDFCGNYVNVFIIVLKFTDTVVSKKTVQNFVNVFGEKARSKCIVVYTNLPNVNHGNLDREIECEFDFVDQALTKGYPVVKLHMDKETESEIQILRNHVVRIASGSKYTLIFFKDAQLALLEKWVGKSNTARSPVSSSEHLIDILNVPKDLMRKLFANDKKYYKDALNIMRGKGNEESVNCTTGMRNMTLH